MALATELMKLMAHPMINMFFFIFLSRLNYMTPSYDRPETLTPAFAAGLERSGKPVRQHALVMVHTYHALII
jgi:hypothetical protein